MRELLENEIQERLKELKHFDVESQEYGKAIEALEKLMQQHVDLIKADNDNENKKVELQQLTLQNRGMRRNNWLTAAVTIGTTLAGIGLTVWGTYETMDFEVDHSITSSAGKGFMGRLFAKK